MSCKSFLRLRLSSSFLHDQQEKGGDQTMFEQDGLNPLNDGTLQAGTGQIGVVQAASFTQLP
jgi:hypothetical protein